MAGKKMGRPPIPEVDWQRFERMCSMPKVISNQDIAWMMGVDVSACEDYIKLKYGKSVTFSEFREQKGGILKYRLLSKQLEVALDEKEPSVPMLIFLGKQYLGQADKTLVEAKQDITTTETNSASEKLGELIASLASRNK